MNSDEPDISDLIRQTENLKAQALDAGRENLAAQADAVIADLSTKTSRLDTQPPEPSAAHE